jgi:hypothetical protein
MQSVCYFCPTLKETHSLSTNFSEVTNTKLHWNLSDEWYCFMQTDGRTDGNDEAISSISQPLCEGVHKGILHTVQ